MSLRCRRTRSARSRREPGELFAFPRDQCPGRSRRHVQQAGRLRRHVQQAAGRLRLGGPCGSERVDQFGNAAMELEGGTRRAADLIEADLSARRA
ncbi:hypothetical protein [Streptomyces sp. HUAS TT20]|uniref:hypothetical protein n=1 Tax=Streptomyces sp. HUAS TT20 TaxID=3447509 RepID=UPI0021DA22B3|nr:hypothetical protein [Streptomyces sp. HUAS 15-9]UXY30667.1 hypothetical protein N8I87_31690 [Streptomyces sp. HUAS 15-9]